jgi:hypothetical protein
MGFAVVVSRFALRKRRSTTGFLAFRPPRARFTQGGSHDTSQGPPVTLTPIPPFYSQRMKAGAIGLSLLILAACAPSGRSVAATTPTEHISVSSSPTASPARTESPSASPSHSPITSSTVTLSSVGRSLSCRLPVIWNDTAARAGFLSFPGGVLAQDSSAPAGALFYDRAYQRWLPVWRESVSADGRSYAYDSGDLMFHTGGKVHVVNVTTGADKVVYIDSPTVVYKIVDFTGAGIYVTEGDSEGRSRGLWFLSPAGGAPRLINSKVESPVLGGGFGWGLDFNTADPSPAPPGLEGPVNRLLRIDLASGVATPWFYRPGANIFTIGSDSTGDPLVGVIRATDATGGNSLEIWSVNSSSAAATRLLVASTNAPTPGMVSAIDRHGVWLDGSSGTAWLYSAGSMQIAATVANASLHIAGGCIP